MGKVTGLKNIQKFYQDEEDRKNAPRDFVKATWFKLKDGESVKVRFLQELDDESPNYNEKYGLGFIAVEHSNPFNFMIKALCTADEGACYGCEQHRANQGNASFDERGEYKGQWKPKSRLYVNVLIYDGVNDPYVAVLSQNNGAKSVTPAILEMAGEAGTITQNLLKITRKGASFNDTSYVPFWTMKAEEKSVEEVLGDLELFDLNKVVREVAYEDQEAHFNPDAVVVRREAAPKVTEDIPW